VPRPTEVVPSVERVGRAFPQLEILDLLGAGGMGVVYLARQPKLERKVALKLLPEHLARDPHFAERFHREARLLARLNHPGIVTVYDFGESGGFFFLLMEYVDGVNLRDAMAAGRFSAAEALRVVPPLCEALQYAHDEGILHRDIKPANILLDSRGRVKIADFGIAKLLAERASVVGLTATGSVVGTAAYMAPEQMERPGEVDHRADIYSLGVVLYEMLTGELPLGRFAPPSERSPVNSGVDEVVLRSLAKDREQRFQKVAEVGTRVEHLRATPLTPPLAEGMVAAAGGDRAAEGPVGDFILCHPGLPRLAQWITVYALVAVPLLWILSLGLFEEPKRANAYAQFVETLGTQVSMIGEALGTFILVTGGILLRGCRRSGPGWLRLGFGVHLAMVLVALGSSLWAELLDPQSADPAALAAGELLVVILAFTALAFEVVAFGWLWWRADALDARLQQVRSGQMDGVGTRLSRVATKTAPHATLGMCLTGVSLVVGSWGAMLAGATAAQWLVPPEVVAPWVPMPWERLMHWMTWGSVTTSVLAVAGGVQGWRAIRAWRQPGAQWGGGARAVFAVLAWPLMVGMGLVLLGVGWLLFHLTGPGLLWMGLTLGVTLVAGKVGLRYGMRKLLQPSGSQRPLPGNHWINLMVMLCLVAQLFSVSSLVMVAWPAYILSESRAARDAGEPEREGLMSFESEGVNTGPSIPAEP
jgi:tRNA A-37 threonylcarbamoyl transferase component Bud32